MNKEELMKYSKEELVDLLLSFPFLICLRINLSNQEKSEIFDEITMIIDEIWFRKISVELEDKKEKEVNNG